MKTKDKKLGGDKSKEKISSKNLNSGKTPKITNNNKLSPNIDMNSIIKEKLIIENILEEEKIEISNIKPSEAPKKPNKNELEFLREEKSNSDLNEAKANRIKAYDMLRKKPMSKEQIDQLSKINNEPLNPGIYQGSYFHEIEKEKVNITNRSNLSLVNQFEQYFNNKFVESGKENIYNRQYENDEKFSHQQRNEPININSSQVYDVKLNYCFGINTQSFEKSSVYRTSSICFHKKEKWVAYLNHNLIIIENFQDEKDRNQIILSDSKDGLDMIKISENGKILFAYSTNLDKKEKESNNISLQKKKPHPQILFYMYNPEYNNNFRLINITNIKHSKLINCEISPQNNLCIVISSNNDEETYISVLDHSNNEILMTTVLNIDYFLIKWNPYLTNLEFTTLSPKIYTFWRINSNDVNLQYQHGDFESDLLATSKGVELASMEYTPPLSYTCTILLLIGLSTGEIWGVDTKTNSINIKYSNLGLNEPIRNIVCSLKYITLDLGNNLKYFKLPFLKEISHDELNIFCNKDQFLKFDSEILSLDLDLMTSEGLILTKKGNLYCLNYQENAAIRLFSVIEEKNEIIQTAMITKDFQFYSLRKIDYNNMELEQISPEILENSYYLITAHKGGVVKVWSLPDYCIHLNFEVVTEEVIYFDTTPNDLKLSVSYSSGLVRFFDIKNETFIGKFKSISGSPYKFLKFLPDGEYMFAVDTNNTLFLIKIEKYEPLLVQIHQLMNIAGEIIDFKLNIIEQYNKFLVNIQNVFLQVYNRKFTNILKNISYDNSIPVFYLQDKFNIDDYLKNNYPTSDNLSKNSNSTNSINISTNNNKSVNQNIFENFHYEFSPTLSEKSFVYILSEGRKLLLVRNFEMHNIVKLVKFNQIPLNISISDNSAYMAILFKDKFSLGPLGEEGGVKFNIPMNALNLKISPNGKILFFINKNSLIFYNIKFN